MKISKRFAWCLKQAEENLLQYTGTPYEKGFKSELTKCRNALKKLKEIEKVLKAEEDELKADAKNIYE